MSKVSEIVETFPVVFVAGLSGAGKSTVAEWMETNLNFLHLAIDPKGIDFYGLRHEWNRLRLGDATPLQKRLQNFITANDRFAKVLTFPSDTIFDSDRINVASAAGIICVVLYGSAQHAMEAVRRRDGSVDEKRWRAKNDKALHIYSHCKHEGLLINAFRPDGSHWPIEHIAGIICERVLGQNHAVNSTSI